MTPSLTIYLAKMHFCSYLWTHWFKFQKSATVGFPGCRRGQSTLSSYAPSWIFRHFEIYQKPSKSITVHPDCLISTRLDTKNLQTKPYKSYHVEFLNTLPFARSSQSNSALNRKRCHISATIWSIDVKLLTQTHDQVFKRPKNSGKLSPREGAISKKKMYFCS